MSDNVLIIIIIIGVILWIVFKINEGKEFQSKIDDDKKIDYKQGIELFKVDRNGIDYLVAGYKDYQLNKKEAIETLFVPGMIINWNDCQWEVVSTPEFEFEKDTNATKFEQKTNYYLVKIRYISNLERSNTYNYGVISNIYGSEFHDSPVKIENDVVIKNELVKTIDEFIMTFDDNKDLSEIKKDLKLLKYEILNDDVEKENISSLVEKMKKFSQTAAPYASLLSAIIGLVQKLNS